MVPVFAGRYSDHLLIENNVWTQDPSGYTEDQSGYSGRVDLTPRPGRMWDTIPWGVVHHGSRAYVNGGLVGSLRAAGSIIIRHNIIRNAYNGVRLRANRCPSYEVCGANLEIYDNEPADIAKNIDRSDDKPAQRCVQRIGPRTRPFIRGSAMFQPQRANAAAAAPARSSSSARNPSSSRSRSISTTPHPPG
jgi:hypothetical protein